MTFFLKKTQLWAWWIVALKVVPDSTLEWERLQILVVLNQNFPGRETKPLFVVHPSCCCEFWQPGFRKKRTQSAKTDPPGIAFGQTPREDISEKKYVTKLRYSGDPNSRLVRYSNGKSVTDCQMVRLLNCIWYPDLCHIVSVNIVPLNTLDNYNLLLIT